MLDRNNVYCVDVLEGLKMLDDESIDVIITSPPYNKKGLNHDNDIRGKWIYNIAYNGDINVDNMPEDEYQQWQIDILSECYRVLKENGSMFYNHKNRIWKGHGCIVSPYQWLFKTPFKIRQEIIWDRKSTHNVNIGKYLPTTELIFWLAKSNSPDFYRFRDTEFKKEVWDFPFLTNSEHPAPFPIKLPDNILHCIPNENHNKVVLDPFMGSGTVAVSAIKNGFDYIGFDKFQLYVDMANKRIEEFISKLQ